jgi:hypothetical protein
MPAPRSHWQSAHVIWRTKVASQAELATFVVRDIVSWVAKPAFLATHPQSLVVQSTDLPLQAGVPLVSSSLDILLRSLQLLASDVRVLKP